MHPNVYPFGYLHIVILLDLEGANLFKALLIYVSAQKVSEKRENMKSLGGDGDTVNPLKPLQVIHYPAFFPSLLSFILQKLGMMMA